MPMQFGGEDIKLFVEVGTPIFLAIWYLRGTLVLLNSTLLALGGRVTKVEKDVEKVEERLHHVETHPQRILR